jgi:hypothetical protein
MVWKSISRSRLFIITMTSRREFFGLKVCDMLMEIENLHSYIRGCHFFRLPSFKCIHVSLFGFKSCSEVPT